MLRTLVGMYLPADNLAAVQIQDQIQVKPSANNRRGRIGHIPAPDMAPGRGDVGGRLALGALARPQWDVCPQARNTRANVDSLASHTFTRGE